MPDIRPIRVQSEGPLLSSILPILQQRTALKEIRTQVHDNNYNREQRSADRTKIHWTDRTIGGISGAHKIQEKGKL